jgi:hypothetical protein
MGRKHRKRVRVQASKRARDHRKQAMWAGLSRRVGHPCHYTHKLHWNRWHWVGQSIPVDRERG